MELQLVEDRLSWTITVSSLWRKKGEGICNTTEKVDFEYDALGKFSSERIILLKDFVKWKIYKNVPLIIWFHSNITYHISIVRLALHKYKREKLSVLVFKSTAGTKFIGKRNSRAFLWHVLFVAWVSSQGMYGTCSYIVMQFFNTFYPLPEWVVSLLFMLLHCHAFDHFACCTKQPFHELTTLIVPKTQVTTVLHFIRSVITLCNVWFLCVCTCCLILLVNSQVLSGVLFLF